MTRSRVIETIGLPEPLDIPSRDLEHTTRYWYQQRLGISVDFDDKGGCELIQAFPPCEPMLDGLPLLGSFESVVSALTARGYTPSPFEFVGSDPCSTDFHDLGIGLWRQNWDEPQIDAVGVWSKAYGERRLAANFV